MANEIQEVIELLEEHITAYPDGTPVIPWAFIRADLIRCQEKLKRAQGYVKFMEEPRPVESEEDERMERNFE